MSETRPVAPFVAGGVAIVLAALFAVLLIADPAENSVSRSPLLGNLAPDVSAETEDGDPFVLSRRKGSWVVLNFFTHNCVPCIREHPDLIAFVDQQRALGNDGAEFYSIVRDSTQAEVDEFFEERGGDWPISLTCTIRSTRSAFSRVSGPDGPSIRHFNNVQSEG